MKKPTFEFIDNSFISNFRVKVGSNSDFHVKQNIVNSTCACCGLKITKKNATSMGGLKILPNRNKPKKTATICYICLENLIREFSLLKKPEFYNELKEELFLRKFNKESKK